MKTFSADALAALQRGDAIVSASVEIIPVGVNASFGVVDFDANDAALTPEASAGTHTINSVSPTDEIVISFPSGRTYKSWSRWLGYGSDPGEYYGSTSDPLWWGKFSVKNAAGTVTSYNTTLEMTEDLAFADIQAAGDITLTGSTSYKIWIPDDELFNRGGLSMLIQLNGASDGPIRLWGGYGDASLPSDAGTSTFSGIGDRGLVASSTGAIGGTAQNLTLALAGIEPEAIAVLDADGIRDASVVVRRLIFDSSGTNLLGAYVFCRGRLDELKTSEMVGGAAAIQLSVEGAARGLGRRGGRARSDADQRLVSSTDGFYRVVSAAPKKTLYWGGKTPSIGGSLTGGGGGTTSASTSISSVRSF